MASVAEIQTQCWDNALHCLGTSYIFSQKAKRYKRWIRFITVLGIIVPLLVGGITLSYGGGSLPTETAILIASPLLLLQLALSGISLGYKWDDLMAYALDSQTDNRRISESYQKLARNPLATSTEMQAQFDVIHATDQARTNQDEKISFSRKEERRGMRYALWTMQRQCATCNKVPTSLTPTDCETCGKY